MKSVAKDEVEKEVMEMGMSIADQLLYEGEQKGREEGREAGRISEARTTLLRLGGKRFGAPSSEVSGSIEAIADITVLEMLLDKVLDAESWDELLEGV